MSKHTNNVSNSPVVKSGETWANLKSYADVSPERMADYASASRSEVKRERGVQWKRAAAFARADEVLSEGEGKGLIGKPRAAWLESFGLSKSYGTGLSYLAHAVRAGLSPFAEEEIMRDRWAAVVSANLNADDVALFTADSDFQSLDLRLGLLVREDETETEDSKAVKPRKPRKGDAPSVSDLVATLETTLAGLSKRYADVSVKQREKIDAMLATFHADVAAHMAETAAPESVADAA